MKRPKTQMPKRPRMATSAVARTPKDAAIKLVRLEFDAARLQMGIDQAQDRAACYQQELNRNAEQRQMMMDILNG
ncbi:MAG: hypothetical protein AAFN63_04050 [Pseudomonadota bacterium]